ncbi:transporter substrate-binding domain-containing protein [Pseudoalteromonas sp. MMG022]|uniref:substrate-binding periplasmic protein n=1 Tax=Pseudoalteromonas sp. MMG022 TaxID=2909978 RepID=UPI001F349257|nr:transporter substrate-binding domain-containing protein [Pseudoalteromonas sp. MMG022]MCF6434132.1 transporter substrate-binding domain-containing protein [Pseudoalteromonas sp. MMG022]
MLFIVYSMLVVSMARAEHIRVVTEHLEPYQAQKKNGELGGFMTEIVKAMFSLTGDSYNIEVMPWARAYETALHESNVLIYSIVHTRARDQHFEWVGEVPRDTIFLWGLKSHFPEERNSLSSLHSFKYFETAVIRGSNTAQYLQSHYFKHLVPVSYEEQLLKLLVRERVALIMGTEHSIRNHAQNESVDPASLVKVVELTELNVSIGIAFNKKSNPLLIQRYKEAFQQLDSTGALRRIKRDWYARSP